MRPSNRLPRRARSGMLVLALVMIFAAVLAILAFTLDRSSRSVLVEVWKAESGHRVVCAVGERMLSALATLGEDVRELPGTGPSNSLSTALMDTTRERSVELTVPTTTLAAPEDSPIKFTEVKVRFQLVAGKVAGAWTPKPLSRARFRETTPPAPPPDEKGAAAMLGSLGFGPPTTSGTPVCDGEGPICEGKPGTTGPHRCSVGMIAVTMEATGTLTAAGQIATRTVTEVKLVHVLADHEIEERSGVLYDVPRKFHCEMSPFYIQRRVREGREP